MPPIIIILCAHVLKVKNTYFKSAFIFNFFFSYSWNSILFYWAVLNLFICGISVNLHSFIKLHKIQGLLMALHKQLIDIREDRHLVEAFQQKSLHNWWTGLKNQHHNPAGTTNNTHLQCGCTYPCEVSFPLGPPLEPIMKRNWIFRTRT